MSDEDGSELRSGTDNPWPVWRRWQVPKPVMILYGVITPAAAAVVFVVSVGYVVSGLGGMSWDGPLPLVALAVGLRAIICIGTMTALVLLIRRGIRHRRMFLELGPHGVVHHDGRVARRIGWADIDRLYELRPGQQLGLQFRAGGSIALAVPIMRLNGAAEVQAARQLIASQLGAGGRSLRE